MAAPRKLRQRAEKFDENILKRGKIENTGQKKGAVSSVGPWVLGVLLFVVVGSALLQVIRGF